MGFHAISRRAAFQARKRGQDPAGPHEGHGAQGQTFHRRGAGQEDERHARVGGCHGQLMTPSEWCSGWFW